MFTPALLWESCQRKKRFLKYDLEGGFYVRMSLDVDSPYTVFEVKLRVVPGGGTSGGL